MASTISTWETTSKDLRAANPPIDTWSSFAPLVDNESVDDGCTSTLFSDTSAAAVQCAIMNPEWKPPFLTKNAGKPLKSGLHKRSILRSEMDANSDIPMAK